ncbi:MAG: isopenicillin N synthase family dioxygenase [Burkholderiaceae bacterium]
MSQEIPIIDLSTVRPGADDTEASRLLAQRIAEAVERIGFFIVTGHGIDASVVRQAFAASATFFDSADAIKRSVQAVQGTIPRGYIDYGAVTLVQTDGMSAPPDLHDSFGLGPERLGLNQWPSELPAFKQSTLACFDAMEGLMYRILGLFAIALDVPADYFDQRFEGHNSTLRLLNYPALTRPPLPGQIRSGEHTDYGAFTILAIGEANPGGLQVRNRAGDWVDVAAPAGSFVINIGDLMMMWTNDRWLSNLHRVVNPTDPEVAMRRRQSIGYFANPRADVMIECFPSCVEPGRPALHPPVTAGEHRMRKVRASMSVQTP